MAGIGDPGERKCGLQIDPINDTSHDGFTSASRPAMTLCIDGHSAGGGN